MLERAQKGTLDAAGWLSWFFGTLGRAVASAQSTLDGVLVKARFWPDTALRDITQLLELGVLKKSPGGGRSTGYELAGP